MSGYIDNYANAGNPVVNITGTSLQLLLNFRDKNASAPNDHAPGSVGPGFGLLQAVLRPPLSNLFDQMWGVNKDSNGQTMQQRAVALVTQEIQSQGGTNVSGSFPSTGTLQALATGNALNGPMFLSYWLAGASFTFNKGPLGAEWKLTFNVELFIIIDTQNWPTLSPKVSVSPADANISANNAGATIDGALQTLGNFFTDQPLSLFQGQEGDIDSSSAPPPDFSVLTDFFTKLASMAIPLGFRTLHPFIDSSTNSLNLRLIHRVDHAPLPANVAAPQGPSLFHPLLQIDQTEVSPNQQVHVIGSYFPVNMATELRIYWGDTSSGALAESDINWGPANGQTKVVSQNRNPGDTIGSFLATGLNPNASYKFSVRDCDQLTCSDWSNWLTVVTQSVRQVNLLLTSAGNTRTVGTTALTSTGFFSVSVTVPADAALGANQLSAEVGGTVLASLTITVVAPSQAANPTLAVIDPNTNAVLFPPGNVSLFVDSNTGTLLGTTIASANGAFTQDIVWPSIAIGSHKVVAYTIVKGQPAQATASVFSEALPA
jgi:hypothetical protein